MADDADWLELPREVAVFRGPGWRIDGLTGLAVSPRSLLRRRPAARPRLELLEPWEQEVDEQTARAHTRTGIRGFPYRPRRAEDVPGGALEALRQTVGIRDFRDVFVVPAHTRPGRLGGSRLHLLTPAGVLGFGPGGVALWVGAPAEPGVRVALRPEQVAAIEMAHALLYARLTILATDARLNIHYNAVAEHELHPLVLSLRRRVAPTELDLPDAPVPNTGLPYKWRLLLTSPTARLNDGDPVAVVAGPLPVPLRSDPAYAAVVLTPRELVVLADPVHTDRSGGRHGLDTHCIPRTRIEQVRMDGPLLRVRVCGADLQLPLGERLSARAVHAFARHLPVGP
ncbi:hypothetical protein ACFYO0_15780 [Streptomyces sp. NPDC006365]|uniref:hypothetical protein n=1 Tax=Streptomyces sp. NPDC006365 TaxID=3364744 RepID=UPI0036745305